MKQSRGGRQKFLTRTEKKEKWPHRSNKLGRTFGRGKPKWRGVGGKTCLRGMASERGGGDAMDKEKEKRPNQRRCGKTKKNSKEMRERIGEQTGEKCFAEGPRKPPWSRWVGGKNWFTTLTGKAGEKKKRVRKKEYQSKLKEGKKKT